MGNLLRAPATLDRSPSLDDKRRTVADDPERRPISRRGCILHFASADADVPFDCERGGLRFGAFYFLVSAIWLTVSGMRRKT
jgi:hypothetical protein